MDGVMAMVRFAGLVLGLALAVGLGVMAAPALAAGNACSKGAQIIYPLSAVMEGQAMELALAEYLLPDDANSFALSLKDSAARRRSAVTGALAGLSDVEADAKLLALLAYDTEGKSAAVNLTVLGPSGMLDDYLALLDRRGLPEHAASLRRAKALFPFWGDDADLRYKQWSDGYGNIVSPGIDAGLEVASEAFRAARPDLLEASVDLALTDAEFGARLEKLQATALDEDRLSYLTRLIWTCVELDWWTPAEADAALAPLPRAQRDLLLADYLMAEVFNGGVHQYFFNSSGTLVPETVEALERMRLPEHADALREAMALFGPDYPRDTDARRDVMAAWSEVQDEALNAPTGLFDDGRVLEEMAAYAKKTRLFPR